MSQNAETEQVESLAQESERTVELARKFHEAVQRGSLATPIRLFFNSLDTDAVTAATAVKVGT